jgi:hypothetical protein
MEEAVEALATDSEPLAELLEEILDLVSGEEEIVGWEPPPLVSSLCFENSKSTWTRNESKR